MIPATPHGELKKAIQESVKSSNLKVKVVEGAGTKFDAYLKKIDKTNSKGHVRKQTAWYVKIPPKTTENAEFQA